MLAALCMKFDDSGAVQAPSGKSLAARSLLLVRKMMTPTPIPRLRRPSHNFDLQKKIDELEAKQRHPTRKRTAAEAKVDKVQNKTPIFWTSSKFLRR